MTEEPSEDGKTGPLTVPHPRLSGEVPRPAAPSFSGNLAHRVGTAVVALPTLVLVFFADPRWSLALGALVTAIGLREFFLLLEARGMVPHRLAGVVFTAALYLETALPHAASGSTTYAPWPLLVLVLLLSTLARGRDLEGAIPEAAGTLLGAAYLGSLGGALAGLRTVGPPELGGWPITFLFVVVMSSDTLAFFVGHAFGRRRLAPSISPGKTVEGAFGGLLGGALGALVTRQLGLPDLPISHALALGLLVSALGIGGDLLESLLKRWAKVKDSGTLLPGHGGMLDRLDSLLFGAPVLYYYFVYGPR